MVHSSALHFRRFGGNGARRFANKPGRQRFCGVRNDDEPGVLIAIFPACHKDHWPAPLGSVIHAACGSASAMKDGLRRTQVQRFTPPAMRRPSTRPSSGDASRWRVTTTRSLRWFPSSAKFSAVAPSVTFITGAAAIAALGFPANIINREFY
jgi:hypothetical protein